MKDFDKKNLWSQEELHQYLHQYLDGCLEKEKEEILLSYLKQKPLLAEHYKNLLSLSHKSRDIAKTLSPSGAVKRRGIYQIRKNLPPSVSFWRYIRQISIAASILLGCFLSLNLFFYFSQPKSKSSKKRNFAQLSRKHSHFHPRTSRSQEEIFSSDSLLQEILDWDEPILASLENSSLPERMDKEEGYQEDLENSTLFFLLDDSEMVKAPRDNSDPLEEFSAWELSLLI